MTDDLPSQAFELPFPDFIVETVTWIDGFEWVQEDEPLFHFVRALKAHTLTRGKGAHHACAVLRRLPLGHREMLGAVRLDLDDEDDVVALHSMWERARFAMGSDPVEVACSLAGAGLIRTETERPGRYGRFLTVAALLQIQVRQKPIYLPARKVAGHMPCQPMTVSSWTGWAMQDGVLVKTKEHVFRSQGESRAAEYVFGLHRWKQPALDKLGALVGLPVRKQDLRWIEDQFAATRVEAEVREDVSNSADGG